MEQKVGRNEPCPCGSGKKYKQCCLKETQGQALPSPLSKRKFTAKVLSSGNNGVAETKEGEMGIAPVDYALLMERVFGEALHDPNPAPPLAEDPFSYERQEK